MASTDDGEASAHPVAADAEGATASTGNKTTAVSDIVKPINKDGTEDPSFRIALRQVHHDYDNYYLDFRFDVKPNIQNTNHPGKYEHVHFHFPSSGFSMNPRDNYIMHHRFETIDKLPEALRYDSHIMAWFNQDTDSRDEIRFLVQIERSLIRATTEASAHSDSLAGNQSITSRTSVVLLASG
ncbi:MAG: hypothetical protein LQ338_005608 [Usnochroma carphineum]|nr:MAG: hypothetical protein LQ338_005608 [Usnochroma carphineum]